jgi:4-hydroxy-tetrahydrodipicolinate reductase
MLKIIISGCCGRMGRELIRRVLQNPAMTLVAAVDYEKNPLIGQTVGSALNVGASDVKITSTTAGVAADAIVDFSSPAGTRARVAECAVSKTPLIVGTTGLEPSDLETLKTLSQKTAVLQATNFSLGVNALWVLSAQAAKLFGDAFEVEIIESHHHRKADAPSGTAKTLLESIAGALGRDLKKDVVYGRSGITGARPAKEIGVHALRQGGIVGEHTAIFASETEIFELKHRALDRGVFADGALAAAAWLAGKPAGQYAMADMLFG